MHAANATTQEATAMIEMTSSVLLPLPWLASPAVPAGEAWARDLVGAYERQGSSQANITAVL